MQLFDGLSNTGKHSRRIFKLPCTCWLEWIRIQLWDEEDIHQYTSWVRSIINEKASEAFLTFLTSEKQVSMFLSVEVCENSGWSQLWITTLGGSRITHFNHKSEKARTHARTYARSPQSKQQFKCEPGLTSSQSEPRFQTRVMRIPETSFTYADLSSTNSWHSWRYLSVL